MKKLVCSLLMMFAVLNGGAVFANLGNRAQDMETGQSYAKCNRNSSGHRNKRAFGVFPMATRCENQPGSEGYKWSSYSVYSCSGYTYDEAAHDRMVPVAANKNDDYGKCWQWTCKDGYVFGEGHKCITPAECVAASGEVKGDECIPLTLCDGLAQFVAGEHVRVPSGLGCDTFKCAPGTCSTTPAANGGKCDPAGAIDEFGGMYGDAQGVCQKCAANQYVNADQSGCTNGSAASQSTMHNCFTQVLTDDKFIECVKRGGS